MESSTHRQARLKQAKRVLRLIWHFIQARIHGGHSGALRPQYCSGFVLNL